MTPRHPFSTFFLNFQHIHPNTPIWWLCFFFFFFFSLRKLKQWERISRNSYSHICQSATEPIHSAPYQVSGNKWYLLLSKTFPCVLSTISYHLSKDHTMEFIPSYLHYYFFLCSRDEYHQQKMLFFSHLKNPPLSPISPNNYNSDYLFPFVAKYLEIFDYTQ